MSKVHSELSLPIGGAAAFSLGTEARVSQRGAVAAPAVRPVGAKHSYLQRVTCEIPVALSRETIAGGVPCAVQLSKQTPDVGKLVFQMKPAKKKQLLENIPARMWGGLPGAAPAVAIVTLPA